MTDKEIIIFLNQLEDKSQLICTINNIAFQSCGLPPRIKTIGVTVADMIDIINRLHAENERLKSLVIAFTNNVIVDSRGYYIKELSLERITESAKKCKAEIQADAIKEFAERLKSLIRYSTPLDRVCIDNLVKEMVGEE